MKKTFILLLFGLMLANTDGFAQIKFGVKGGVNLTDLSFDELPYESDAGKSFFVGPVAKISLPIKRFGIELGALYDYRSAKVISTDLVGAPMYKSTLEQKQIVVPISLRYDYNLNDKIGLYAFAGPQLGFLIDRTEVTMDYGDWLPKKFNLSANIGVGTTLWKHLEVALAYNIICTKSAEVEINKNKIVDEGRFNAWQLSLGYYF